MAITMDEIIASMTFRPGDLVVIKENFKPSKLMGLGLVVAVMQDGAAEVLWPRGPRLVGHAFDQLVHWGETKVYGDWHVPIRS
jgi:hypothetical protein